MKLSFLLHGFLENSVNPSSDLEKWWIGVAPRRVLVLSAVSSVTTERISAF